MMRGTGRASGAPGTSGTSGTSGTWKAEEARNRKRKAFISLFGTIFLTVMVNLYMQESGREVDFPASLYGIPTYADSRLVYPMSSLNGDPYIAVFLTRDRVETVLAFYKKALDMDYRLRYYGRRGRKTLGIYQFPIRTGALEGSLVKGVEVVPLNSRSRRVYRARTKIKIILPAAEVAAFKKNKEKIRKNQ